MAHETIAKDDLAFCTIVSKNYLAQARVLGQTLAAHHPGSPFHVLIVDRVDGYFDPAQEPFALTEIEELYIPNLSGFCFQYNVTELNTAAKPYFLEHLFERHAYRKLVYLDPDIMVFNRMQPLSEYLDRYSIVLTPHLTGPCPDDGKRLNEVDILLAGTYNLGFIAVRSGPTTSDLLAWWQERLYKKCVIDQERGLFVDQKWIDLVPGFFEDVFVLRHPGYNTAYWNLHERTVTARDGQLLVNGRTVYFHHFSGFDPDDLSKLSKYQNRLSMHDIGEAIELFERYQRALKQQGHALCRLWPYAFANFDNGVTIGTSIRRHYLSLGDKAARFGDPFCTGFAGSYFEQIAGNSIGRISGQLFRNLDQLAANASPLLSSRSNSPQATKSERGVGVNLAGYFQSEKGVGEAARCVIRSLEAEGIPFVLNNINDCGSHNGDQEFVPLFSELNPFPINIILVNADQLPGLASSKPAYMKNRYNIGYWNWELSEFPPEWCGSFDLLDEVWTPSTFCQDSIASVAPLLVRCVPYAISVPQAASFGLARKTFALPDNKFLFLFAFDYHSFLERKNPIAVIEAFRRAFGDRDDVGLVLKTVHAADVPAKRAAVQAAAAGRSNITLLDCVLNRDSMHDLMMLCDAYVSLHRSEGFGLTLAEAMAMQKPVVGTAYSSTTDFMTEENSYPVRYRLIPIEQDYGPYRRGYSWADPDLDHAAELMHEIATDRIRSRARGQAAKQHIHDSFSPGHIGSLIRNYLLASKGSERAVTRSSSSRSASSLAG